jgi:hypothetical protein
MACPFFMPTERFEEIGWRHRTRLPLGDGWKGFCTAPGQANVSPEPHELGEFCNLGYAKACPRLPRERAWDAVRFCVTLDRENMITIMYVCEAAYRPGEHGILEHDCVLNRWISSHRDARIQKMAECYLQSYLSKRNRSDAPSVEQEQAAQANG